MGLKRREGRWKSGEWQARIECCGGFIWEREEVGRDGRAGGRREAIGEEWNKKRGKNCQREWDKSDERRAKKTYCDGQTRPDKGQSVLCKFPACRRCCLPLGIEFC